MGKEILTFGDIEVEKNKFYHNKTSIFLKDVDIEKVLVSRQISFGEKNYNFFIGYLYNYKVKPLHKMLPKTNANVKSYDGQTKWMYFLIEDDVLLEKYNTIWDKVTADIKKEFGRYSVYNKNFLKIKIRPHGDEVTDFYDGKFPKVDSNHTCLAVITFDPALKKKDSYYPQVFLKKCKYIEKKITRYIINDVESSFDDSDDSNDSDED